MDVKKLPKIELHLHLDGSVRIETAKELLEASYDVKKYMVAPFKCESLDEYLTKFELPLSIMQTKENLERISSELVEDLEKDGVIYAEIRFAPSLHTEKGLSLEDVVESVLHGLSKGKIKINLILCMMRGQSFEKNKKVVELSSKYFGKGVCSLDLAGSESRYPISLYKELFVYAERLGVPFTIHAGEASGSESIENALKVGAKRIGHGIRVVEDPNLLKYVIQKKIPLEICPTSNIQTNAVSMYQDHPIRKLYNENVCVTVSTDNRTVSSITLTEEYERLIKTFRFTKEDFFKMNENAVFASFLPEEEKQKLYEKLNQFYL